MTAPSRLRLVAYWITTLLIALEMVVGGSWDLARIHLVRAIMNHLGYPLWMLSILGFWKLAGAFAILIPRFTRLKEWAYAGMFFNYTGATASHLFVGDGPGAWDIPAILALLAVLSWSLRPPSRILGGQRFASTRSVTSAPPHPSCV
ncbi:MAG TPA: DoxX family protein [Acidobacteriaceae bacterium]|nr:DoxX family protein [Acidobacteriaceae bacterium]